LAVLALALVATACATAPAPPTAAASPAAPAAPTAAAAATEKGELDNAPDGASITIKRGGELMVKLDTNLTTGFQWTMGPAASGPPLSMIGNPIYVNKGSEPRFLGAGGSNVFRFKAEQAGQVMLQFDHKRPWETGAAPAKSVRYTVVVAP